MQWFLRINRVLLILLDASARAVKLAQMPDENRVDLKGVLRG